MTVENEKLSISYLAGGSATAFPYDFLVYLSSHMVVTLDDVEVTEGWSITGLGDNLGGQVTFEIAPIGAIVLTRTVPFTQLMDYTAYDAFPAESHEIALDLSTMRDLQMRINTFDKNSNEVQVINSIVDFTKQVTFKNYAPISETEPTEPTHLLRLADVTAGGSTIDATFVKYLIPAIAGQTVLTLPTAIAKALLFIDGVQQSELAGAYILGPEVDEITLSEPLVGGEIVDVWVNNLVVITPNTDTNNIRTLEDFGAIGDGLSDDTSSVVAAFASGLPIIGTYGAAYLLTGQVLVPNGTTFDGRGCNFVWNGVAGGITYEGRDWGVFQAVGVLGPTIDTHVMAVGISEFEESSYPVGDSANFAGREDQLMFVFAGSTGSNPELPSFALMTQFINITGTNKVSLDYRSGWDIPSGLSITYKEVEPVRDIRIGNFTITDISPDSGLTSDYATAVSLAFAQNCHVFGLRGIGFRNPLLFAQYCNNCTSSYGRVERPKLTGGGQGYHTQWSYSLRCNTHSITGYLARHIVDHTKSSYCNVTDCGDTNTADGAFTNHGSYEHDISYTNCHGWHSVGNSGPSFGESAKRINIVNGNGIALTAGRNIIDLSVFNSTFGRVLVNSQGFQADGLTVGNDGTTLTGFNLVSVTTALGRTTLSKRENIIKNSSLAFNSAQALTDYNFTGRTVYLENTHLRKINSSLINTGAVAMNGGSITGTTAGLTLGTDSSLKLVNVDTDSFGVRHLDGCDNGHFIVDGGEHTNIVPTGIYSNRQLTGKTKVEIRNVEIDGGGGIIIDMPDISGTNQMFMDFSHNTFSNGSIEIKNIYSGAGKLFYTNNLEVSVTRTTDITGGRRLIANNITA